MGRMHWATGNDERNRLPFALRSVYKFESSTKYVLKRGIAPFWLSCRSNDSRGSVPFKRPVKYLEELVMVLQPNVLSR